MARGSIDPDLLRTFLHISETGSFTQAGAIVGRTQSAVSMQMRRLEALLDRPLISRGKGGAVRLTAHGSKLVGHAKEMLAYHDAIWDEFHTSDEALQTPPDAYAVPLRAQRAALTTQIMMTLLTDSKFTQAYAEIMRCVESNSIVDPIGIDAITDDNYLAMLSMIEYISINFLSNTIDREIVLRQRRSGLLRVWETLAAYIEHKRSVWKRPNAYRSFELLVRDHLLPGVPSTVSAVMTTMNDPD